MKSRLLALFAGATLFAASMAMGQPPQTPEPGQGKACPNCPHGKQDGKGMKHGRKHGQGQAKGKQGNCDGCGHHHHGKGQGKGNGSGNGSAN